MNTGLASPMQAPGWPQGCFALELAIDEAARSLKMDRRAFRRLNNDNPVRDFEFELGARMFGWKEKSGTPKSAGPLRRGIGAAAEELSVALSRVDCKIGDTRYPFSIPSGGSMTGPFNTPAVRQAGAHSLAYNGYKVPIPKVLVRRAILKAAGTREA